MARKKRTLKRQPRRADSIYGEETVSHFIHCMMKDGKKSIAEKIFYASMDSIEDKTGKSGIEIFKKALENVMPSVEVRSRRVGGMNYQVPVEVPEKRMKTLAIKWIIRFARDRNQKSMEEKLTAEIIDASNSNGGAVKKREEILRMADSNRAFSHYKW